VSRFYLFKNSVDAGIQPQNLAVDVGQVLRVRSRSVVTHTPIQFSAGTETEGAAVMVERLRLVRLQQY